MARTRVFSLPVLVCASALSSVLFVGCGEDETPAAPEAEPAWSDHAGGDVGPAAGGSPDGETPVVRSAETLLKALHTRVAEGRGMADVGYDKEVRAIASVLWPPDGSPDQMAAAQAHVRIAAIAAQVGGWLAEGEGARAERTASHPMDVKIHDAFLKAAESGPEAYAAWCGDRGVALLQELEAARRERFFGKR